MQKDQTNDGYKNSIKLNGKKRKIPGSWSNRRLFHKLAFFIVSLSFERLHFYKDLIF